MDTYVLDTSVIIKWYFTKNEAHTKQAQNILRDIKNEKLHIVIPSILAVELLNVFIKGKKLQFPEIQLLLSSFYTLPLTTIEPEELLLVETAKISQTYNIAAYDALFVALAREENCQLISDDSKAHGKITDGSVLLLQDYN